MNAPITTPTPPYHHTPLFPLGPDKTPYRKLEVGGVTVEKVMGQDVLVVAHETLRALAEAAFTDIISAKKGRLVFTDGSDEGALAEGARDAYLKRNLRYSQLAPISMFEEKNTK